MKGFLSTVFVFTFLIVAIVGASGDAAAMQDAEGAATMIIGTVVNTVVVMAKALVGALGGIGPEAVAE